MQRLDFQKLLDIKKTQLEMVRDRGYEITEEELPILNMDVFGFLEYTRGLAKPGVSARSLVSRSYVTALRDRSILVYYGGRTGSGQKQVPVEVVREFINLVQTYPSLTEAILIVDAALSSTGDNELKAVTTPKWQVFFDYELTYNPTLYVDTPYQELLSPEAAREKLHELKADISKLLIMKVNEPIARYYGWTVGNLIRIHRDDQAVSILSSKSNNYRIVIS